MNRRKLYGQVESCYYLFRMALEHFMLGSLLCIHTFSYISKSDICDLAYVVWSHVLSTLLIADGVKCCRQLDITRSVFGVR